MSQEFVSAWITKIGHALEYEDDRNRLKDPDNFLFGPGYMGYGDVFPLGIVPQCVKLIGYDIYEDGHICLYALQSIEYLARVIKEEDRPAFRQQLYESKFVEICVSVRKHPPPSPLCLTIS